MKMIKFGDNLEFPIDVACQTLAFIARKGSGKTYAAGVLVEGLVRAGVQVVILDTVGNWYGLRISADGKSEGLDIPVLGGLRGDIPLTAEGGALTADVVADTGRSLIVDVSQFSQSDRKRFAAAFGRRLWQRKKAEPSPSPVHLVLEECQLIIPQMVRGDDAAMVGIFEEIVRLGRNYGIGVSMITQRPQSVNKEVLTQTECLVVLQVNGVPERKALKEWVVQQGMDVNLLNELPSLPIGTAWVWSPQWLQILKKVTIGKKTTLDASSTPRVGEKRIARELKPLDLADLRGKMAATIEENKKSDPRELRKTIAELERKLSAKPSHAPEIKRIEVPVLKDGQIEKLESLVAKQTALVEAAKAQGEILAAAMRLVRSPSPTSEHSLPSSPRVPATRIAAIRATRSTEGSLPKGEVSILKAIAQYPGGADREQLTILTGYKRSTRDTYIQRLRERGFIGENSGRLVAEESGVSVLGSDFEPLPTGKALCDHWLAKLPEGERKILEVLVRRYPLVVPREDLGESTGFKRSTRDTYLQRLGSRKLIEFLGRGEVQASAMLFD